MKKITIILSLVLIFALLLSVGSLAAEKIKIGVSTPSADHGWTGGIVWYAQKAINEWKAKDPDIEFFFVTADNASQQVANVEDLMVKDIDALVILAHDSAPFRSWPCLWSVVS